MTYKKIFIDTEFTDFVNPKLISIGMVSVGAEKIQEFYYEVPYPLDECNDFVIKTVIPLLGKDPNKICSIEELNHNILTWLISISTDELQDQNIQICFDYHTDWDLFKQALNFQIPDWITSRLICHNIIESRRIEYFNASGLPQHHALWDAYSNLFAYDDSQTSY
jgi:hypothetical protein